jgi:NADH-quinone oxidoreductase subunit G
MPRITIDGKKIEVPLGTKVIQAAEQLGIVIPRFCYHPALGSVGACRVCAINCLEGTGPVKGIQMSCMLDSQDGMVVTTQDEHSIDFRRQIIEWLMLNHPHDCPVCDEGGHCLLQDYTISGGHGIRTFKGEKRTHKNQLLGPLVQHEMNRCIQCYRCVRYYQEYTGFLDFGVMGSAQRIYYGRFEEGTLESPFSGNLIDICPTGVFTDKPSRYEGRKWDFERTPGICVHCSLGCHTTVSARNRKIVRQEARFNKDINGHFICDRGRYGFDYVNLEERPRKSLIDKNPVDTNQALDVIKKQLVKNKSENSIAVIGSTRNSLETMLALNLFCDEYHLKAPVFFNQPHEAQLIKTANSNLRSDLRISMQQIESADSILLLNTDPMAEAPMLALALRQAVRNGAKLKIIGNLAANGIGHKNRLPYLDDEIGHQNDPFESTHDQLTEANLSEVAADFEDFNRPVVICGTRLGELKTVRLAAELVKALQGNQKKAGLFYVHAEANSAGAALMEGNSGSMESIIDAIENGIIKTLIVVESDLWAQYANQTQLTKALDQLDRLIVLDYLNTPLVQKADVIIPTQTVFETGGTFVNQECRAQTIKPAFQGGLPLPLTGNQSHPPRIFTMEIPGGNLKPAHVIIQSLLDPSVIGKKDLFQTNPICQLLSGQNQEAAVYLEMPEDQMFHTEEKVENHHSGFRILLVPTTFGTEPLSQWSTCLKTLAPKPYVAMAQEDAQRLGIRNQDDLKIRTLNGNLVLPVVVGTSVKKGLLLIPTLVSIAWQQFDSLNGIIINEDALEIIKKE